MTALGATHPEVSQKSLEELPMLSLLGSTYKNCDGFTRRNCLQVGAPLQVLGLADLLRT